MKKRALIIVDPQNDFMPNGSLAVTNGNEIIPVINKVLEECNFDYIIITQDWHGANHKSFASQYEDKNEFDVTDLNGINQILWPDHCVQNTTGAMFHPDLNLNVPNLYIFKKGYNDNVDSYSGFYDNDHKSSTGLSEFLKKQKVTENFVCGLAYDFCVSSTAIDSVELGFKTSIIMDATKAITDDILETKNDLEDRGVLHIESNELLK